MRNVPHHSYLAKILHVDSQIVIAEFNRKLHLPLPAFGTLIKIDCKKSWVYGLIADARLKGESQANNTEFFENPVPQDTEIHIIPVGYLSKEKGSLLPIQDIPPETPSAGDYVFVPNENELQLFTIELGFLRTLLRHPSPIAEGLIITTVRKFSTVYPDSQSYFIRVTQELSRLTHDDRAAVQRILSRTFNSVSKSAFDERIK